MKRIEEALDAFVAGKISYSSFSEQAVIVGIDSGAETYDVQIGDLELQADGEIDTAKIYRGVRSTVPPSVHDFKVLDPVLIVYVAGDRNRPLIVGGSDGVIMDITKVNINPRAEKQIYIHDQAYLNGASRIHVYSLDGVYERTVQTVNPSGYMAPGLGIAFSPSRDRYYATGVNSGARIRCFDTADVNLFDFEKPSSGNSVPNDIAVDPATGNIYATFAGYSSSWNHRVVCFDPTGAILFEWGSQGSGDDQFGGTPGPEGIDVRDGYVYVCDGGNNKIKKFDLNGNFYSEWSLPFPQIRSDNKGYFYAASDTYIRKIDAAGVTQLQFGNYGAGDGEFYNIGGIDVGSSGRIYALDTHASHPKKVQIFDEDGAFVSSFGVIGTGTGEFKYDSVKFIGGIRVV
ncbi:MAG: hypothetical protein V3T30_02595 [Thermodesulfobacteriota bacterium]